MKIFKLIKLALILTIIPMPITLGMTSDYVSENGLYSSILKKCNKNSGKLLHKALIQFIDLDNHFCRFFELQSDKEYEIISSGIRLNFNMGDNEGLVKNVNNALSHFRSKLTYANLNPECIEKLTEKIDSVRRLFRDENIFQAQDIQPLATPGAILINKKNKVNIVLMYKSI